MIPDNKFYSNIICTGSRQYLKHQCARQYVFLNEKQNKLSLLPELSCGRLNNLQILTKQPYKVSTSKVTKMLPKTVGRDNEQEILNHVASHTNRYFFHLSINVNQVSDS